MYPGYRIPHVSVRHYIQPVRNILIYVYIYILKSITICYVNQCIITCHGPGNINKKNINVVSDIIFMYRVLQPLFVDFTNAVGTC